MLEKVVRKISIGIKNNENKTIFKRNGIYRKFIKRPLDIILSLIALIVLSPVMLVTAILVRIRLGSPVIFKQQRPGLNEKIFTIYKFRTMTDERNENGELLPDSERLTGFGKMLRSTSLDELPELFNILKGDMSIVGPRPLSVKYLAYYNKFERKRHNVRPGLTGLAQVNGRNTVIWEQRFKHDIRYVNNVSPLIDFKILVKTIEKVIKQSDIGIAGIDQPKSFHKHRMKQIGEERETELGQNRFKF